MDLEYSSNYFHNNLKYFVFEFQLNYILLTFFSNWYLDILIYVLSLFMLKIFFFYFRIQANIFYLLTIIIRFVLPCIRFMNLTIYSLTKCSTIFKYKSLFSKFFSIKLPLISCTTSMTFVYKIKLLFSKLLISTLSPSPSLSFTNLVISII